MNFAETINKERLCANRLDLCKYIISVVLAAVMCGFILITGQNMAFSNDVVFISIAFSLIYLVAMLIVSRIKDIELLPFLFIGAGVAAMIYARVSMLSFVSMDYYNFIQKWLNSMSDMSVANALTTEIGDYNLPYLYFLVIVSRFSKSWMFAVKAFSCIFDVVLAYYVMKIASLKIKNTNIQALVFVLTLAIPTVFLNSAYWAQCDGIYGSFCVASLYYAFTKKGTASMVMFAFAFAFKLQAVFILPIILVCCMLSHIDWYKLLFVPFIYAVLMFPAIICGRGFADSMFIYFRQASQTQYKEMTLNATSIWTLLPEISYATFKWVGIMLAGLVAVVLLYLFYIYKDRIELKDLVIGAYISAVALPFFLPSMHDRYFFLADILSVCVFLYNTKKWYVPLVTIFASFTAYANFLVNDSNTYNLRIYTLALMVVVAVVSLDFIKSLVNRKPVTKAIEE